jgi:putative inorganic carbon (HCO3(-)) transporter
LAHAHVSSTQLSLRQAAFYFTAGSAVSALFSIAACQILLALALAALLLSGDKMRFLPIWLPLGLFMLGTVISLALSADPSAGRPQIRKFFVFLMLLVVYSTFRNLRQVRNLVLIWAGVGGLSAALALAQFQDKFQQSRHLGRNFYEYYVAERITGFMSHWMTFGGQMMIVLLMLGAFVFYSPSRRRLFIWLLCGTIILGAIVLGFTRSIWLATAAGGLYLVWYWRRPLVLLAPAVLALGLWLGPNSIRERFISAVQPHGELDSNEHRIVTWRTGWRIVEAHPWFGLGPENVKLQFKEYIPADIPRPLPPGWYGHLHNIYLHYAAERGVPTMLALMWMLGKILYDFARALRRLKGGSSEARFVLHGAVAVILAILIAGIFELNLGDSEVLTLFLTVVAFGYIAADSVKEPELA